MKIRIITAIWTLLAATPVFSQTPWLLKDIINGQVGGFWMASQYFYTDHPFSVVWEKNGKIYFTAVGYSTVPNGSTYTNDVELWMSDGTTGGTELLKDINPGNEGSYPGEFHDVNGILYFTAYTAANGKELWKTDGTPNGTVMVKDIISGSVGGFSTSAQFGYDPITFDVVWQNGNEFFFIANNFASPPNGYINDVELWKSDGTDAGTVMLKDIYSGHESSYPLDFHDVNGTLYFTAYNDISGRELWKTDGSSNGTVLVKEIIQGNIGGFQESAQFGYGSFSFNIVWQTGSTFYFIANNFAGPMSSYINDIELWKSDGTSGGTEMVKDIYSGHESSYPRDFHDVNGTLYFAAYNDVSGLELWKTDGTTNGTVLVKEIIAGAVGGFQESVQFGYGGFPFDIVWQTGSTFYFKANNYAGPISSYVNDVELWKSDGTAAGTVMVKDINPGYESSDLLDFTDINGTLYFTAYTPTSGRELWKSDGTNGGTQMVKEIISGNAGGFNTPSQWGYYAFPFSVVWLNGSTFYFKACAYVDAPGGSIADMELWKSDGTDAGTVLVKDINPGNNGSYPESFNVINNTLYFTAENPTSGRELWKSDGTTNGTEMLKEFINGSVGGFQAAGASYYYSLPFYVPFNIGSYFYFTANDYASVPNGSTWDNNIELWKSDGTTGGTTKVMDIHPSTTEGSFPEYFHGALGKEFFTAFEPNSGRELWIIDIPVGNQELNSPASSLEIFPVPSRDVMYINYQTSGNSIGSGKIILTDIKGKELMKKDISSDASFLRTSLDVSSIAPGIYFVKCYFGGSTQIKKVIKQ